MDERDLEPAHSSWGANLFDLRGPLQVVQLHRPIQRITSTGLRCRISISCHKDPAISGKHVRTRGRTDTVIGTYFDPRNRVPQRCIPLQFCKYIVDLRAVEKICKTLGDETKLTIFSVNFRASAVPSCCSRTSCLHLATIFGSFIFTHQSNLARMLLEKADICSSITCCKDLAIGV